MARSAEGPTANASAGAHRFGASARPTVLGRHGMVSTGHYLASTAAIAMLLRGGNAVDAGVAAGLCLNVVHNDMNTLSGVAPIIVYLAAERRVVTLAGIGPWPARVTREGLLARYHGMPDDLARCVVPAAADAWLRALRDHGTLTFAEVSAPARRYAGDGFPVHTFMHHAIQSYLDSYRRHPENRRLFLVDGDPPPVGTILRQPDLHATLERMVAAEQGARGDGRQAAIQTVRDHFYRGPIATAMVRYARENGGFLEQRDLADFQVREEPEVRMAFEAWELAACGPWSQGPALPMALNVLRNFDLRSMGHNSSRYVNTVASALELAFADRNAYCGDPDFVAVPIAELLAPAYGRVRAELIRSGPVFRDPPPPGDPVRLLARCDERAARREDFGAEPPVPPADTSCVTVADGHGNLFAATPSDGYCNGPVIPGLGLHISERGSQAFFGVDDPNVVAPGKRPRLTPNPVLLFRHGQPFAAMATPGNDRQVQAMLQVFLNLAVFGMSPQEAVEAPRFASYNFRASTWPGNIEPGRLCLEGGIDGAVHDELREWGRDVLRWPKWCWSAGGVCLAVRDSPELFMGAGDPRRESYAIGF